MKIRDTAEYGDFQTPASLAARACARLTGLRPRSIVEPTCGQGTFVRAAALAFPKAERILGFELNRKHLQVAADTTTEVSDRVTLQQADFFDQDWSSVIRPELGPWLIVGNPPWVTSAELGSMESSNMPQKSNFQGRRGFDAITGKANFDISEWMLLQALDWLGDLPGTIAVLCKTSVARKVLTQAWSAKRPISASSMFKINALSEFGAAVDACFFVLEVGSYSQEHACPVYESLDSTDPVTVIGFDGNHLLSNADSYRRSQPLMGNDPKYVWRSGVKHDCSKVMELRYIDSGLVNGFGELVDVDPSMTLPILKSSDIGNGRTCPRGEAIITQSSVGMDTSYIRSEFPRTWSYLLSYAEKLDRRGSVIYKKAPRFAIFGVGAYTFSPWKVAISGFYKKLSFIIVPPHNGRPVVFDDTVYFLSCSSEDEARFVHNLLSSELSQNFYNCMVHWDEKRPITVGLLKRLSLRKVAEALGQGAQYQQFSGSLAFAKAA